MDEKRVILVDDDVPTSRFMRLILEPEGYALAVAKTRDEALTLLSKDLPDAIVMDYRMPGLAVTSFVHNARALGFQGPILLCTATRQELHLPVDDVLFKPFDPNDLTRKLSVLLSTRSRGMTDLEA